MRRFEELKKLDVKSRNRLRAILGNGDANAISGLANLRSRLGKDQSIALEAILSSPWASKASRHIVPFPKFPPFADTLRTHRDRPLKDVLAALELDAQTHRQRLLRLANSFQAIDSLYASGDVAASRDRILATITRDGWSHAILRKAILIRENMPDGSIDEKIEDLVHQAGIKSVVVASLIHAFSLEHNILTTKRSVLNIADRGAINRYTRTLSRLTVQPFASSETDLANYLSEVEKCSLLDALLLASFNSHLFEIERYPALTEVAAAFGQESTFALLAGTYNPTDSESEYAFFKQSSAWMEYRPVRKYRILTDHYYDASKEEMEPLHGTLKAELAHWIGEVELSSLVASSAYTKHGIPSLSALEASGNTTRSALFNYWMAESEGQIGFERTQLLKLMGLTRDLARTVPIKAVRTAAKLSNDKLVRLILLLLLGKRSKNELDGFLLRKVLSDFALQHHDGSLVKLVRFYESSHPYVAEFIYDIATEDFLAKLNQIAPHRADIPEIRASLHEWMAGFSGDERFLQRARTVRIDHQINRVRNEIDDHRIYVDPARFSSWIEDEMMIDLNGALTSSGAGKKAVAVTCDEAVLSLVLTQSYSAFCSSAVFGIASYLGRRIRHGTFHGHLYSSVINAMETNERFQRLFSNQSFLAKWNEWKDGYNTVVEAIISERLHVNSKAKPHGILTPEIYGPAKQEILAAAVRTISADYVETTSMAGIDQIIIDYCWRLAEHDLVAIVRYLKAQQTPIKNGQFISEELMPAAGLVDEKLADAFRRELEMAIDRKLTSMFGWFKRPSIVAPKAFVSLLFAATVAEVQDTIPDFDPQAADSSTEEIELVGDFYHLVYDSLAIVVGNAAKYADRSHPLRRKFTIVPGKVKRLKIEISASIKPSDDPLAVSKSIEERKAAEFHDANMYDRKSGISKLMLLASSRNDFELAQYEVVGNEVQVTLVYALEH